MAGEVYVCFRAVLDLDSVLARTPSVSPAGRVFGFGSDIPAQGSMIVVSTTNAMGAVGCERTSMLPLRTTKGGSHAR